MPNAFKGDSMYLNVIRSPTLHGHINSMLLASCFNQGSYAVCRLFQSGGHALCTFSCIRLV